MSKMSSAVQSSVMLPSSGMPPSSLQVPPRPAPPAPASFPAKPELAPEKITPHRTSVASQSSRPANSDDPARPVASLVQYPPVCQARTGSPDPAWHPTAKANPAGRKGALCSHPACQSWHPAGLPLSRRPTAPTEHPTRPPPLGSLNENPTTVGFWGKGDTAPC